MTANNLPKVGDVIMSPKFPYGHYGDEEMKFINIDGKTMNYTVIFYMSEDERVALAAKTGIFPPKTRTAELGAYDQSRAAAKFVVEAADMQGGSVGRDSYPDGWHVRARRLNKDGIYDPDGEVISFYMSGHFAEMVEPKDVHVVGQMKMMFI